MAEQDGAKQPAPIVHSAESQWALVWREFRKRRLAHISVYVVVLLVTLSIFAPFLANDRPIYYQGYNRFEYRESLRTAAAVLRPLTVEKPPPELDESELPGSEAPANAGAANTSGAKKKPARPLDRGAVAARMIRLMAGHLADEQSAALEDIAKEVRKLAKAAAVPETAAETRPELLKIIARLEQEFGARRVTFASRGHFPVIASLGWTDVTLLVFNLSLLFLPAWLPLVRRVIPPEHGGRRTLAGATMLAGIPLLVGFVWWLGVPERIDRTKYKQGVLANAPAKEQERAPVVYSRVTWPPVPYALDEGKLRIKYLPPVIKDWLPAPIRPSWGENPDAAAEVAVVGASDSATSSEVDQAPATAAPEPLGPWDKPHWLGTDEIGRDLLTRMLWGGRISLSVGIIATLIELVVGVVLGALAGYFRGWVDLVISRIIEIVICFPSFFLILAIVVFLGPSIYNIMLVIGLTGWTGIARLIRGEFLRLADQEFVLAARALGYTPGRIIFRHVLPNALAPVLVTATFAIAGAILIESGLSFLGFGITEPTPSWGGILSTGRRAIFRAPWIIYFPGLALFVTITAYNLVGEALRDAADPRLRGRM